MKAKKVSEKKRKTVLSVRSVLKRPASEEQCFFLCNGKIVRHFKELADELATADDSVFYHHVQAGRNDFAAWVKDVFQDVELAEKLQKAMSKDHVRLIIYKHITDKLW